ncbi:endolytic transglycosylase MltG [Candidatus Jorgensenbacteria bacterium CG10_big_fil_rev_8_21_14_0_10_54_38]|uniref:Endolytic murein transglycosylase n=2 Tax=Candidatus Joergenseniibacteriota TaxID=1752739 RepID=A0A2M6WG01_9BACT|nr:MAG: endolytic transglycosylase MltG [Candidatus Jorgensenbacteria bacterium CG10_big_fil_rev_8_21_14_0_10_54_38]
MNPPFEQRGLVSVRFLSVLGLVLFFIVAVAYVFYGLQPASTELQRGEPAAGTAGTGGVTQFKIAKGDGFREIGARLSQESLIKSIAVFKFYALLSGRAQRFQPGIYGLSPAMSVPQMVGVLTAGGKNDVLVTVPEGSTVKDIDALLTGAGVRAGGLLAALPPSSFSLEYPFLANVRSLEGFLFPDSYYISLDASAEDVARQMLDNFMRKAWPSFSGVNEWYERLTLASFLEREVETFADRQVVAGILLKRLRLGMPLQVDATLSYAKCGGLLRGCETIRVERADVSVDSPYNTYQRLGWTPTPIANPGAVAIRAALSPAVSPYLYYLSARGSGTTYFSRTLEEHNAKRARYL